MESIEAAVEPYCRVQDLYQTYYRASLAAASAEAGITWREDGPRFSGVLRFLGRLRLTDRFTNIVPGRLRNPLIDGVAWLLGGRSPEGNAVGSYVYTGPQGKIKFCIDAEDPGELGHPDLLAWSDLYFKTNYWPTLQYPAKVHPLANINPLVLSRQGDLRAMRDTPFERDIFGFFRVWGRIDHNLAVLRALAALKCSKKLIAYLISLAYEREAALLDEAGIPWVRHPMGLEELWQTAAKSRLNIVRHGVADCIPWRMTDMLAMGHCPVLDYHANTEWHVPLQEGVHYLSLGVPPGEEISPEQFAQRVTERVDGWLSNPAMIDEIARNGAAYFDENLAPAKLGSYIIGALRNTTPSVHA